MDDSLQQQFGAAIRHDIAAYAHALAAPHDRAAAPALWDAL